MKKTIIALQFLFLTALLLGINEQSEGVVWNYESAANQINLHFNVENFDFQSELINGKEWKSIAIEHFGQTVEEGLPMLPTFSQTIAIPDFGDYTLETLSSENQIMENILIKPYQTDENVSGKQFSVNEDFYQKNEMYPTEFIELSKPAIMRNVRLLTIKINPFQYNPATKRLTIKKNIELQISFSTEKGENEIEKNLPVSRHFDQFLKSTILNYDSIERNRNLQQPCYLFIYPDNSQVETTLRTLTNWKKRKGFEVHSYSTAQTGTSTTTIKNFIQNAYNNWENPPDFITLVGDAGGSLNIPTGSVDGGEGDQYYVLLEGNDILADAFIGRLSINTTTELQTIISKIINYEKQPYMGMTEWYNKALLVGDPNTSGQSCIITNKNIKEMMAIGAPNITPTEVYSGSFASQMSTHLNSGVSYFNYRGWLGMSGFNTSNIDNLNNGYMLPVTVTLTCGTGSFSGTSDSINERFLKAGTPTNPKGAIAAIATATIHTHTTFNNCVAGGIFYGLFIDGITHMGGALNRGKFNLYHNFPDNPNNAVYKFSYWNNLMGDPGMNVWTKTPEQFTVQHETNVDFGNDFYEVHVYDSYGFPVKDAWVTILQGDYDIFASDYTDENGRILLPLPENANGNFDLTVTKQNFIPYLSEITISTSAASAYIESYSIFDGNSSNSTGNSNGQLNPGETIEVNISFKNYGSSSLSNVTAMMTCNHSDINVEQATASWATIPANGNVESLFRFEIAPEMSGSEEILFEILIEDSAQNEWQNYLFLPIFAPELMAINHTIYDGNNQTWDPGENVEFAIQLENLSSIALTDVSAEIITYYGGITFIDSLGSYSSIPANGTSTNTNNRFAAIADWQLLPGSQIPFQLILTNSSGFSQTISYSIPIGTVTVTDPLGPDAYGYYCYDDGDSDYELAPTYNWLEIDPSFGGSGTTLSMSDNGDNGALQIINLPFQLQFYGESYSQITVCSNGFLTPGITEQYSYMNWHIPGPLGPSPMIAPFWDDLQMGSGRVCYYYDSSEHRFVIQWSRLQNDFNSAEETFQVILYDSFYYPSITGDNDILFQYKVVNNTNSGNYNSSYVQHGQFATVGLEDHTSTIALEYTYNNTYPTAAKALQNNMALLFTTNGGQILAPPIATVNPGSFEIALLQNNSTNQTLQISNTGEASLSYSVSKNYIENEEIGKDTGGPDNYGYQWFDNSEPNGPTYFWREISALGTEVTFVDNDEATEMIPLQFDFSFYGENYSEFRINPNGWLGFGDDSDQWLNSTIPNSDAPKPAVMPFWDDLNPFEGGNVYYYSTADSLIVQFDEIHHYVGAHNGIYTFQAILYPNGKMLFQYKDVSGTTDSVTIGLQNADATDALQISYNANYVHNELAIEIKRVIEWVNINNVSGLVPAGQSANIGLLIESDDLNLGNYLCEILITTNDPEASLITVPLQLSVLESFSDIEVNVDEFHWGEMETGQTINDTIVVSNIGIDPLIVSDITVGLENCAVDVQSFTLQQNQTKDVILTFTPQSVGTFAENITIYSNDPVQSELEIPIFVSVVSTSSEDVEMSYRTELIGNFPNPFNPETDIRFSLDKETRVTLDIFNIKGEKVRSLIDEIYSAGMHNIRWNGLDSKNRKTASGVYLYRLKTSQYQSIQKMILLK